MGRTTHRSNIWCSKHFFFIISYLDFTLTPTDGRWRWTFNQLSFTSISQCFQLHTTDAKFSAIYHLLVSMWHPNRLRALKCLEHQTLGQCVVCPSNPVYYIENCLILRENTITFLKKSSHNSISRNFCADNMQHLFHQLSFL